MNDQLLARARVAHKDCKDCAKKDWIAEELRDAADLSAEREACAALLPPLPLTLDNAV